MFPPDVSTTFVYIFVCIWGHLEIGLNQIKSAKDYAHPKTSGALQILTQYQIHLAIKLRQSN